MTDRPAPVGLALVRSAEDAGGSIELLEDDYTRWSSATFVGGLHLHKIGGVRSAGLDAWLERLANCDLAVPGHDVVSVAVASSHSFGGSTEAHIEVMTVRRA